jgi:hypothetical protein
MSCQVCTLATLIEIAKIEGTGITAVCSTLSVVCIRSSNVHLTNIKVVKI